jgi:Bacterial conjugation TrbI-like protein
MTNSTLDHDKDLQNYDNSEVDENTELEEDGDFYEISYEDDRENYDRPSDLEAIADDDEREAALGSEDDIPLHQKPWVKVAGVVGTAAVAIGATGLFFAATQPKNIAQKAEEVRGKDSTSLNFGAAPEDANKTEIALGKQRDAFAGTTTNASPASDVTTTKQPTVATSPNSSPNSSPSSTVPPVQTLPPKTPVVATAPVVKASVPAPPPVVKTPVVAPVPVAKAIPQNPTPKASIAAPIPSLKAPLIASSPTPTPKASVVAPIPLAKVPLVVPTPVAKASVVAPVPVTKVPVVASAPTKPSTPELSPEEQWLKLSEAGRFGGRYTAEPKQLVASSSVPANPQDPSATVASPALVDSSSTSIPAVPKKNNVINLSDREGAATNEDLIPVIPPENNEKDKPNPQPVAKIPDDNTVNVASLLPSGVPPQTIPFQLIAQAQSETKVKESEKLPLGVEADLVNNADKVKLYKIAPGTRISGTLLTPVQASGSSIGEQMLVIKLDQPILDQDKRIAVKAENTQITFKWNMQEGWIQATSESLVIDGKSVAIPGAFVLQGVDGQPLVAGDYRPGASEIAAADQNTFLLGAASGVGDILTQPDTTIQTNVFGGNTSTSAPNRNILGAILKGGGTPVLDSQKKRTEQRTQAILARKPIWYLQPGTRVNIFTTAPLTVTN